MSSPALLSPLRAFAEQLLDSAAPRCIWQPLAIAANEAFRALFPRELPAAVNLRVERAYEDGQPSAVQIGEANWTFTPLQFSGERAVYVELGAGSRTGTFDALPAIVRSANPRDATVADVQSFAQMLYDIRPQLFTSCALFLSRSAGAFVLVRAIGGPFEDTRRLAAMAPPPALRAPSRLRRKASGRRRTRPRRSVRPIKR